mgnify:CR=1 FL=1
MELRFTPEENAFRQEVRHFFRTAIPEEIRTKVSEGRKPVSYTHLRAHET